MSTELQILPKKKPVDGLVYLKDDTSVLSLAEQIVVKEAEDICLDKEWCICAILFRRYSDSRESTTAAYIVNNNDNAYDKTILADLQRTLWLNGRAPLIYINHETRVDILSCARGNDFWVNNQLKYNPADTYKVGNDFFSDNNKKSERYNYAHLVDGTFWDQPENAKLANADKTSHKLLLQAVVDADKELKGDKNAGLRRLLLIFVLVKYLEDRSVFPSTKFFGNYCPGARTFLDVLRNGSLEKIKRLFKRLEYKFNGDIFTLSQTDWNNLTESSIRTFAKMVDARFIKDQGYLWDQFSFRYIPAEVLSHLYQHFADRKNSAIFTPPFLASLLLDHVMPYEKISGDERVCDPTCGSGIFLVGALRRLIAKWRCNNNWKRPTVNDLKRILRQSVYGVDIEDESLRMAAFNLALAVCDALMPDVIWRDLKFDNLIGTQLFRGDFFANIDNLRNAAECNGFDIIIGNPPFGLPLTTEGLKREIELSACKKGMPDVPDNQIAYSIARQSIQLLKAGGRLCLIQPSGLLYNANPESFLCDLISRYQLNAILDFTSIRSLYYGADPKTIAIFFTNTIPSYTHNIKHNTFRRTISVKEQICFELDHYDCHIVPQQVAINSHFVWRTNLLGGGRLFWTVERLRKLQTLKSYIKHKGWEYGEGFIAAKEGKREEAKWLTGLPLLPTEALTTNGIDEDQIVTVEQTHFRSAYSKARYAPPLLLIKANEMLQSAVWENTFLAYKDKIIGISGASNNNSFNEFCLRFIKQNRELRFFVCLFSAQYLVGKATAVLKQDLDMCPWPDNITDIDLLWWEKDVLLNDMLDYMSKYVRLGQKSILLKKTADDKSMSQYASIYVRMLGAAYPNLRSAGWQLFGNLICQRFCFGDTPSLEWGDNWEEPLQQLVYHQRYESLRTVRVIFHYLGNTVLIIKPARLRYWIGSVAIQDADETLTDLLEQGY